MANPFSYEITNMGIWKVRFFAIAGKGFTLPQWVIESCDNNWFETRQEAVRFARETTAKIKSKWNDYAGLGA